MIDLADLSAIAPPFVLGEDDDGIIDHVIIGRVVVKPMIEGHVRVTPMIEGTVRVGNEP